MVWALLEKIDLHGAVMAFVLTAGVMWLLRPCARRLNLLDYPRGDRKFHAHPTPVVGGLAMFAACIIVFMGQAYTTALGSFMAAATLLVATGLVDDVWDIRWYWRILIQVLATLIIIYWGGVRVEQVGPALGLGEFALGGLSVPLTVFVTVGLINALNLIDGVDGLAGLLGLAAIVMFGAAALYAGNDLLALRLSVLAGALAGFLMFNARFPWQRRARVFMGNAGSAFLGLVIAWSCFRLTQNPSHPVNPVLALWLVPIPVMDCLVLVVRRLREGRSPFSAGRDHIHHIMHDAGYGPTAIALSLTAFTLLLGLGAGQAMRLDVPNPVLLLVYLGLCVGWYALTADRPQAVRFFRALGGAPADPVAVTPPLNSSAVE